MKTPLRRAARGEEGQVLVMLAVSLVALMGLTALAIDLGSIYHSYSQLQASANAAAAAGALELPNADWATVTTAYSSVAGGKNARGDLPGVTMASGYPQAKCVSFMVNLGLTCDNAVSANAVAVVEQVTVPTFFAKVIGVSSMTLKAYSLSAMKGGTPAPANVMVILDSTASMGQSDSDPNCSSATGIRNPTKLDCAKWGTRILLQNLSPCAANLSSCGSVTNGNVPNPVDTVGLLTFPGMTATSELSSDYLSCGSGMKSTYVAKYATPNSFPPYFTIVQPSSDYRTSDSGSLNGASSDVVKAVDWQNGNNCGTSQYGIQDPGGVGTYYAGVIAQAQTDLSALGSPRDTMQNAIILLSDGDANATCNAGKGATCSSSSDFSSTTPASYGQNECHAAITAAGVAAGTQNAAGLKTWVYSIAFGAPTGSSCSTDSPSISGCTTMSDIASDPTKFYSDQANGCVSPDHSGITSLGQIFQTITYDFLTTRTLPFGTQ
jgi:hypothetical protein